MSLSKKYKKNLNESSNNKLLKQSKMSSAEYQKAKTLENFNSNDWKWDSNEDLYVKLNEASNNDKSPQWKEGKKAYNKGLYQRDNPYSSGAERTDWDNGWVYTMQLDATSSGNKKKMNEGIDVNDIPDSTLIEIENALGEKRFTKAVMMTGKLIHGSGFSLGTVKNSEVEKLEAVEKDFDGTKPASTFMKIFNILNESKKTSIDNKVNLSESKRRMNEADGDPLVEGSSVKIIKDGEFKGKSGKVVSIKNVDSAIKDYVINIDGQDIDMQTGDFYNTDEDINESVKMFENKDVLSKADIANVLSLNSVNGKKFSDSDINDDVLNRFNSKWSEIHSKNPNFDPFGLDMEMEDADVFDVFMDLITSLSNYDNKLNLFENKKDFEIKKLESYGKLFESSVKRLNSCSKKDGVTLNENINKLKTKIRDIERFTGTKLPKKQNRDTLHF